MKRLFEDLLDDIGQQDVKHRTLTADDAAQPEDFMLRLDIRCDFSTNVLRGRILTQDLLESSPLVSDWIYTGTELPKESEYLGKYAEVFYLNIASNDVFRFFSGFIFPLCRVLHKTVCGALLTKREDDGTFDVCNSSFNLSNFTARGFLEVREGVIKLNASDVFLTYAYVVNTLKPEAGCQSMQGFGIKPDLAGAQYDFLFNVAFSRKWKEQFRSYGRDGDGMTWIPVRFVMDITKDDVDTLTTVEYVVKARNYIDMAVKLQVLMIILDDYLSVDMSKCNLAEYWPCQKNIFKKMYIDYSVVEKALILIDDYPLRDVMRLLFKPTYTHKTQFDQHLFNAFDEKIRRLAEMDLRYKLL